MGDGRTALRQSPADGLLSTASNLTYTVRNNLGLIDRDQIEYDSTSA